MSANGGIRWQARWVNVSHVLGGEYVGLEEIDDGEWDLYFGPLKLGRFHERCCESRTRSVACDAGDCYRCLGLICHPCPRPLRVPRRQR